VRQSERVQGLSVSRLRRCRWGRTLAIRRNEEASQREYGNDAGPQCQDHAGQDRDERLASRAVPAPHDGDQCRDHEDGWSHNEQGQKFWRHLKGSSDQIRYQVTGATRRSRNIRFDGARSCCLNSGRCGPLGGAATTPRHGAPIALPPISTSAPKRSRARQRARVRRPRPRWRVGDSVADARIWTPKFIRRAPSA
jgi:hypothetical protein